MITSAKTILIGSMITSAAFIGLVIYPLFSDIQAESAAFISQKKELAELEAKAQGLSSFQRSFEAHKQDFEKMASLFIDPSEPVEFIDFLEGQADRMGLALEILPLAFQKEDKPWPSMNFRLSLSGDFPAFLRFIETLESAPYLVHILNLNIVKKMKEEPGQKKEEKEMTLLIKVYAKQQANNQD